MKLLAALLILTGPWAMLRADDGFSATAPTAVPAPLSAGAQAATPVPAAAEEVEQHFQAARKAYLAGDRDGAMKELNQALKLDPYHPGSAKLYETIREEERGLRQVRLVSPEAAPAPVQELSPVKAPAASGGPSFWKSLQWFQAKTDKKILKIQGDLGALGGRVDAIQGDMESQEKLLSVVREEQKHSEVRQDQLFWGFIALLIALVLLLIMALRILWRMKADLNGVESRLHEHPGRKRAY